MPPQTPRKSIVRDRIVAKKAARRSPKTIYLIAFNALSCAAWAYLLVRLVTHLANGSSGWSWKGLVGLEKPAEVLLGRMRTSYAGIGEDVKWVQTLALLEIAHVALGLVRSSLVTTAMQVASRLILVWYVAEFYGTSLQSASYSTMVLAWSLAEIIRYTHYALNLLAIKLDVLEWIRYTAFYILYPLGAGSEAALIFLSAPFARVAFGTDLAAYAHYGLTLFWPPALFVMMSHMHRQRRKHLGEVKGSREPLVAELTNSERKQILKSEGPARSTRSAKKKTS